MPIDNSQIPKYLKREAAQFVGQCRTYAGLKQYKADWVSHQYKSFYPANPLTPEEFAEAKPAKLTPEFHTRRRAQHKAGFEKREYAPSKRFLANRDYYDERSANSGLTREAEIKATARPLLYRFSLPELSGMIAAQLDDELWRCHIDLMILSKPLVKISEQTYAHSALAVDAGLAQIAKLLLAKNDLTFEEFTKHRRSIHENAWSEVTPSTHEWLIDDLRKATAR
jgi:hypothetical protein